MDNLKRMLAIPLFCVALGVLTQSSLIALSNQTIVFEPLNNQPIGTPPLALKATATSGLAVSFTSNTTTVCSVSGTTATLLKTGFCSITASRPGDANYNAATPVTRSFDVTAAVSPSGTLVEAPGSPVYSSANLVTGDFNGDGFLDIAGEGEVALGNGMGGFTLAPASTYPGTTLYAVATGDFNGDGIADLAVTSNLGVSAMLGDGTGRFTATAGSPFATGTAPISVAVGDFNGDGILDIVTANEKAGTVTVLLGNGSGGFTPATGSPFTVGTSPYCVVVADFNGDGALDIATANAGSNNVTVLLGNGSGGFAPASGSPIAVGTKPVSLATGDFNRDGIPDLVVSNFEGYTLTVLLGYGSAGGFTVASNIPVTEPYGVAVGDLNGDGIPDLAVGDYIGQSLYVFLGDGSGNFTAASDNPVNVDTYITAPPLFEAVGDFNGDGKLDVATSIGVVLLGASASTNSTLSSTSPSTITASQPVPLTLTVSDTGFAFNAPTGTATFYDGATVLGMASQSESPWTFTIPAGTLSVGRHTLSAAYSGDSRSLSSTSNTITIQVTATTPQTITFGPLRDQTLGSSPPPLSATASSGLPVSFASNSPSVCTVSGNTSTGFSVTLVATGVCSITATQAGNGTYSAAPPVTQTFTVSTPGIEAVAAFLDESGAPALTFDGSTSFPDAGGFLIGPPGVTEDLNGNVYVVGLDSAGGVHLNSYSSANSTWNGWQYSGGILDTTSGLTAAVAPNGIVWFTGRDIGNRYWINSWNGTNFGGWILVADGIFASDSIPQVAIPSDGSIYVVGKDIGGRIWSNSYSPTSQTFTGWVDRQAVMIGQPSATAGQDGMVYVAVRSESSESPVYITQIPAQNAATANTWISGGGQVDTDPYITAQGGTVYLTALGDGGAVYLLTFAESNQTFGAWSFTNGSLNDETIAAAAGNVFIAGRDSADRIYWYSVTGNNWFLAGGAGLSSTVLTGAK